MLRTLYGLIGTASASLAVGISPGFLSESDPSCPYTSSSLTGTGSGGAGGYSYAWDFSAGGTGITINSPSIQSTTLTVNGGGLRSGTLRCTVTDANTDTAVNNISVDLECGDA